MYSSAKHTINSARILRSGRAGSVRPCSSIDLGIPAYKALILICLVFGQPALSGANAQADGAMRHTPSDGSAVPSGSSARVHSRILDTLPVSFVANQGQWLTSARFVARAAPLTVGVDSNGLLIQARGRCDGQAQSLALRFQFEYSSTCATVIGEGRLPGDHNFYLGSDTSHWHTGAPGYATVVVEELYDGVDLVVAHRGGQFEYDLRFEPSADIQQCTIRVDGGDCIAVRESGELVIGTLLGELIQQRPVAWYELPDGVRHAATVGFQRLGGDRFAFQLAGPRLSYPLVVDPPLEWSSYFGGSSHDQVFAVAIDNQGRYVVGGDTLSSDLPTTPGAWTDAGESDGFVAVIDQAGPTLVYSSYLGGFWEDHLKDLAVGTDGSIAITGITSSSDFPTTPGAFDTTYNHGTPFSWDGFVTRMLGDGSGLIYSTYLGGSNGESFLNTIAMDSDGSVTVAGGTRAANYPTTPGAYDTTISVFKDAMVTRLRADGGALQFSTFIGGTGEDLIYGMHLLPGKDVLVSGQTYSPDFPTSPGAYLSTLVSPAMGFISRLNATGEVLTQSTLFAGSGASWVYAVNEDQFGRVVVAGTTASPDFPTTAGAIQSSKGLALWTGFISILDANLSSLLHSTYFGSPGTNAESEIRELTVDGSGNPTITGFTNNQTLLTTAGSYSTQQGPGIDAFVSRMTADLTRLLYSSYLGGSVAVAGGTKVSRARDLAFRPDGAAVLVGDTSEADFPVAGTPLLPANAGKQDAFLAEFTMLPIGVEKFGFSTPGCLGHLYIGVTKQPVSGDASFGLFSSNSPPNALGALVLGVGASVGGIPLLGIMSWIDPQQGVVVYPSTTNAYGWSERGLPLPSGTTGLTAYAQFLWVDVSGCGVPGSFSASNGLAITVQ
jgi:hypothetical protein